MNIIDIAISVLIAIVVNLATPHIRSVLISGITKFKVKAGSTGVNVFHKRLRQLEESLDWYRSKNDTRELLKWVFPRVFEQIIFLWVLVLLPYFFDIASGFWQIPDYVFKGSLYGIVGLCTRYFISFFVIVSMAEKSLYHAKSNEENILKQINDIKLKLGLEND
ncbi:MAG: hypothetical protein ACRDC6_00155 [Shewanella sp.]